MTGPAQLDDTVPPIGPLPVIAEMIASWQALRTSLAPDSITAEGMPCCCACGRCDELTCVAAGVFGCRDCLDSA